MILRVFNFYEVVKRLGSSEVSDGFECERVNELRVAVTFVQRFHV